MDPGVEGRAGAEGVVGVVGAEWVDSGLTQADWNKLYKQSS